MSILPRCLSVNTAPVLLSSEKAKIRKDKAILALKDQVSLRFAVAGVKIFYTNNYSVL